MGSGRAIVSTPFAGARELLADGRGVLAEDDSAAALGDAISGLLADPTARAAYGRAAHDYSRTMLWSEVGGAYRRLLATVLGAAPGGSVAHGGNAVPGEASVLSGAPRGANQFQGAGARHRNAPVRALGRRPGGR
jgi:hypothetical protein